MAQILVIIRRFGVYYIEGCLEFNLVCHLISVLVGFNVLVLSPRPLLSIVALFICQFSPHNRTLPSAYETQICVESFIHLFIHSFIRTFILSPIYSFAQLRLLGPVL